MAHPEDTRTRFTEIRAFAEAATSCAVGALVQLIASH